MMSEWQECKLGDIAKIQTGPFGSQLKNEQYVTGGTPVVTVEHINDFKISDFDYPSVTDTDKERLSKYLLKKGDIIFSRVGSVDLSAYVKTHQDGWMFSSRMLRVRTNENVDSRFLSYVFQQKSFREYILSISVGATMPSINTEILKSVSISYPFISEQKAIANILSSLDDKIDLLHRQNKTLEAMAETLFRQWFIEEQEDNCKTETIENLGRVITGKTPSTKNQDFWGCDIEFVTPTDFKNYGKYILHSDRYLSLAGKENIKNSVVPKNSIVVTCIGSDMGKLAITEKECITNQQINSLTIDNKIVSVEYVFQYLKSIYPLLRNMAFGGTTMPIINKTDFSNIEIPIPNTESLDQFNLVTESLNEKILNNTHQIKTLEKLRDNLLPKLMSGEVRVAA